MSARSILMFPRVLAQPCTGAALLRPMSASCKPSDPLASCHQTLRATSAALRASALSFSSSSLRLPKPESRIIVEHQVPEPRQATSHRLRARCSSPRSRRANRGTSRKRDPSKWHRNLVSPSRSSHLTVILSEAKDLRSKPHHPVPAIASQIAGFSFNRYLPPNIHAPIFPFFSNHPSSRSNCKEINTIDKVNIVCYLPSWSLLPPRIQPLPLPTSKDPQFFERTPL